MIFLMRLLQVLGGVLAIACMFGFVMLVGRRGDPLIDAPEYIPAVIAFGILGLGMFFMGGAFGSDRAPIGAAKKRKLPMTENAGIDPADARALLDHVSGKAPLSHDEMQAAFGRAARAIEASRTPEERARRDAIANLQVDNAPVRLKVMVPPRPSDSWVGGNPSMPRDMAWPDVDGKPAIFYAQIAAHHLPPGIWGWHGPRSGWLLFFGPGDYTHGGAVVLHTTELGEERPRPMGQAFRYYRYGGYDENAQIMMGDAGLQPPKWPVEVLPATANAAPAELDQSMSASADFDLDAPGCQPFDWPTLIGLVSETISQVKFMEKSYKDYGRFGGESFDSSTIGALLTPLHDLLELLLLRARQTPFSDAETNRVLTTLKQLSFEAPVLKLGVKSTGTVNILARIKQSGYPDLHDMRARHVYTQDPASLPAAVRARLEPQWKAEAEAEVMTMGGSGERFMAEGDAVLLELVPSRLFSWTFGDYSNFAIMLRPGDLLDERWDKAYAMDDHGI